MEETFKAKLQKAGVSDAAIQVLEQQEFTSEDDLKRGFTYEQFQGMGILAKSARILADLYPVASVQSAPPSPVSTRIVLGKESLSDLVRRAATGDSDAIEEVSQRVGNRTVFVRSLETGKMDVEATLACIQFCGPGQDVDHWGTMPTESLASILLERRQVNPITRHVLTPGDQWLTIPVERRVLPLFGQHKGMVSLSTLDEDTTFDQLSKTTLSGRWARIEQAYKLAKIQNDPNVIVAESLLFEDPSTPHTPVRGATRSRSFLDDIDPDRVADLYWNHR